MSTTFAVEANAASAAASSAVSTGTMPTSRYVRCSPTRLRTPRSPQRRSRAARRARHRSRSDVTRARTRRAVERRARSSARMTRVASPRDASTYCGSFSSTSACSGVFDTGRPHLRGVPAREVEDRHRRHGRAAAHERVEAAPVLIPRPIFRHSGTRRSARRVDRFPDAARLIRIDAGAADRSVEQATDGQRVVADHLGRQSPGDAAREPAVRRVLLRVAGPFRRVLPVSRRRHDQLVQGLDIPAAVDETAREPVEQLGMRRRFALRAEVIGVRTSPRPKWSCHRRLT